MEVQCYVTGEFGDSSVFYQVGSRWFKSEEVYKYWKHENNLREQCYEAVADVIGISNSYYLPTVVYDEMNFAKPYGYEIVHETIRQYAPNIKRHFKEHPPKSDYAASKYAFAVFKAHYDDVQKRIMRQNWISQETERRHPNTEKSTGKEKLQGDFIKRHDISEFLT